MLFCFEKLERNKPASEGRSLALSTSLSPVQKVQQLQLLNGKLRSSLRRLYSLQREKAKLQHRVKKWFQWFFFKIHFNSRDFYFRFYNWFNRFYYHMIWYIYEESLTFFVYKTINKQYGPKMLMFCMWYDITSTCNIAFIALHFSKFNISGFIWYFEDQKSTSNTVCM